MRKPLLAGNWKMHGSRASVATLVNGIKQGAAAFTDVDILVCPSFVHLAQTHELLADSNVMLGAQNLYLGTQGAYTGEVSGAMLAELGCRYVIVGHSERRAIFHENLALVADKFKAATAANLHPILCVGETQGERATGDTNAMIEQQVNSVIQAAGIQAFKQAVIAYEPVWAIGTGLTATPEQAQTVHALIRQILTQNNVDIGNATRILYGGSMKPDNAAALLSMPDIDGGLIGGASLDAQSFLGICAAASKTGHVAKTG